MAGVASGVQNSLGIAAADLGQNNAGGVMPAYTWSCHVCGGGVPAGAGTCPACGAPAVLSGEQIDALRRKRSGLPPLPRPAANPKRTGWIFLGAYGLVIALILLFIVTAGGDMAGLLLIFPALPWPLLGDWLFGAAGLGYGVVLGLVLNGLLAFGLG